MNAIWKPKAADRRHGAPAARGRCDVEGMRRGERSAGARLASRCVFAVVLFLAGVLMAPTASAAPVLDPFSGNALALWKQYGPWGNWSRCCWQGAYSYGGSSEPSIATGGYIVTAPESGATVSSFVIPMFEYSRYGTISGDNWRSFVAKWDGASTGINGAALFTSDPFKVNDQPVAVPGSGWRLVTTETTQIELVGGAKYIFGWTQFDVPQDERDPRDLNRMGAGAIDPAYLPGGPEAYGELVWTSYSMYSTGWAAVPNLAPMQINWNSPSDVPEPGTLALLVGALGALGLARKRRQNAR